MSDATGQRAASEGLGDAPSVAKERPTGETPLAYAFGPFRLDPAERRLLRGNEIVALTPKAFDTLLLLVRNSGHLLQKDELIRMLWPDTFVEEGSLSNNIFLLRKALGEDPAFIETVPRRGYRFVGAVRQFSCPAPGRLEKTPEGGPAELVGVGLQTASPEAQSNAFQGWKRRSVTTVLAAAFVIVVGVIFWIFSERHAVSDSSSHLKVFPLTGSIGGEADPAFSPDGKEVAYIGQDKGQRNFNVYVKLIGAGRPLRLTSNTEQERFPAWSPDGRYIAFLRKAVQGNDVYVVPALGGSERRLTYAAFYDNPASILSSLSWSPDGKLLAIADKPSPKEPISISLVSVEDGKKRKVTWPPADSMGDICPAFSPDGRAVAFIRLRGGLGALYGMDGDVYVQDIAGDVMAKTAPQRLTFDNVEVSGLDWAADGRSIVFSSNRSGSPQLWRMGLEGSKAQPVALGGNAVFPSISRKGGRLAFRQDNLPSNGMTLRTSAFISDLKLSGLAKGLVPARFCPSSQGDISPQFSPDGAKVVFSSRRSGDGELWLCKNDGSSATQLTSLGGFSGSPMWSPDGQQVAFDHMQGGHIDIRIAGVEQGLPLRLTSGNSDCVRPSWSNDGKWIYFSSDATGSWELWKIPSQGGTAVQITRHGGFEARESPDGKFVYYVKELRVGPDGPGIWKIPFGGREETRLLDQGIAGLWAVASRGIYFIVPSSSGGPAVKFFNFTTQRITQIALLPEDTSLDMIDSAFAVSPDAKTILYGQAIPPGNIIIVENFR
jgi:Tol biopolymer transport system component/DNA-binding winged helix-turn-helix (wHTH) protein